MPKSIVMVAYFDIFGQGGMPTSAQRILRVLSRKGWTGTIVCESSPENYKKFHKIYTFNVEYVFPATEPWIPLGVPILIFKYWIKNFRRMLLTINTVKKTNPNIIFIWGPPNFPQTGVLGILPFWAILKKFKNLKVVVRVCGGGSTWIQNPVISKLFYIEECAQIKYSDRVVHIEHFLRDHYPTKYSRKCEVITNSVDVSKFYPMDFPDTKIVMYVGRFTIERGIQTFLEAVNILKLRGKDKEYRFVAVGSGHLDSKCKKFAEDAKLNIEFWGEIPHEDMPNIYNQASVVTNPATAEGIGNITLEAMACGKCVIRKKSRIKDYLIIDEYNGFLFTDSKELADKIILAVENVELRKRIEKNAYQTIIEKYTEDIEGDKYDKLFTSLLE